MNITDFLLARIREDEQLAHAATGTDPRWESMTEETADGENIYYTVEEVGTYDSPLLDLTRSDQTGRAQADHIARHNPARVLAECEAKREVIRWWVDGLIGYVRVDDELTNPLLPIAAVYKDHPDYRQEWSTDAV